MKIPTDPSLYLFLSMVIWAWIIVILGMTESLVNPEVEPCKNLYTFSLHCDPSNIATMYMELLIAFVVAGILAYAFYSLEKREREKIDNIIEKQDNEQKERIKMAKKMIGENLVYQAGLLQSALVNPTGTGRIVFSGKTVTIYEFVKETILSSNSELTNITNVFSREIDKELLEELLKFSSHITFLFKQDLKVNDVGLEKSKETIQKLLTKFLPEYLTEFNQKTKPGS